MTDKPTAKPFTGRHMAMILVAFFGVVVTVNFTMATFASRTFGGLVVENSYVASQKFNGWLEDAREQDALGWTIEAGRIADGRLDIALRADDQPLAGATVTALARHPLGREPERTMAFRASPEGDYRSVETLPEGRWIVHVAVKAHGNVARRIIDLQ